MKLWLQDISSPPIYNTIKKESQVLRNVLLFLIASGVWGLFMQNMGLFVPMMIIPKKLG